MKHRHLNSPLICHFPARVKTFQTKPELYKFKQNREDENRVIKLCILSLPEPYECSQRTAIALRSEHDPSSNFGER